MPFQIFELGLIAVQIGLALLPCISVQNLYDSEKIRNHSKRSLAATLMEDRSQLVRGKKCMDGPDSGAGRLTYHIIMASEMDEPSFTFGRF